MDAADRGPDDDGDDDLAPGQRLGRFELGDRLGEGGMGWVFHAHDPELHRPVAVKVLRPEVIAGPLTAEAARARLRREAQAMARLAHPNVIAVHEVGTADERVFVVMELVAGGTLRRWLDARPRTVAEIVGVFVQAGRGLAAAHQAGLVHRDFKPENVLVGDDGRARVTDFGLVGQAPAAADPERTVVEGPLAMALTQDGARMGTPAYMSPEQHLGEPATAASDQFSFCVALYEALWRDRPFRGDGYRALIAAVTEGAPAAPPPRPRVPARLRRAVLRGLARDPAARFPSMEALLAELEGAARGRGRGRWAAVAALGVAAAGLAWWSWPRGGAPVAAATPARDAGATHDAGAARPRPPPSAPSAITHLGGCAEHPVFLDDDETIVFDRSLGMSQDLFAVPATGGDVRRLTSGPDFHWNPRPGPGPGEVTFIHKAHPAETSRRSYLARLGADGTATDLPGPEAFLVGAGVVPVAGGTAYARLDGSEVRLVASGVDRPLVTLPPAYIANDMTGSRDGRWLAIDTARTQGVCLVDTRAPAPVAACRAIPGARYSAWFTADASHYYQPTDHGLLRVERATGATETIAGVTITGDLTVSRDERRLVYSDCVRRGHLLEVGGTTPVELAAGRIASPAIAPDGRIVFQRTDPAGSILVVRSPDGSIREITGHDLPAAADPAWDPDGRRVVFRVPGRGIYVVDLAPYPPQRLTEDGTDIGPRFLDDGRIVFTRVDRDHNPTLWIVDASGDGAHRAFDRARWAWDVDRATGQVLISDIGFDHFFWWDPTTGHERAFPAMDRPAARGLWLGNLAITRDGGALYVDDADRETWRVPIGGSAPKVVFKTGAPYDALDRPVPLAQGVAVLAEEWSGELYRVDLPAR